jgi:hypothetical protein
MTEEEQIARANRAAAIVNDPVFKESMAAMQKEIVDTWAASPARDRDGKEWLWNFYQVSLKFEEQLKSIMNTGKIALDALQQRKTETAVEKITRFWSR